MADKTQTVNDSIHETIQKTMRETAPLYDAQKVLQTWLRRNGVVYGETVKGYWITQSSAPSNIGVPLETHTTFSDMLEFALNQCAENIRNGDTIAQREAATHG